MENAVRSSAEVLTPDAPTKDDSGLFSIESVLKLQKLIFAGSPLSEVLTNIAQLVESQAEGMSCTIWLPDEDGKELYCAAAPSLPGFIAQAGTLTVGPKGGSCGTAIYRRESVYVTDILTDPIWDDYRDRMLPYGIRSVWSRPLFTSEGKALGTFSINYPESRSPSVTDLKLIENASHIAGIAIERHMNEQALHRERDRLRLLLEITNSMTSKLDLRRLVESLSTDLLRVTRCDFCSLLLPDADSGELRMTILYNPEPRGYVCDGIIPIHGSLCGKAFWTGKTQHFNHVEEHRNDPETFGNCVGRPYFQRHMEEGLISGCDLPLIGRGGVVGVLAALKRSARAYSKVDVAFLEQVASQVAIAVENALDYERAIKDRDAETKQRRYLEEEIRSEFTEIVGESPALKTALSLVSVVAPTDSSVLILGETGTGKELVARAIHKLGSRSDKTFVKLNCAAIPLGLLESELFGHEKGAFTGAIARKTGRFELANKGTLFLDEVGDIPLELQAKLLRVLQEQEFERLGSNRTHRVNVRLVAATHRNLHNMMMKDQFRSDLYYRLNVFPVLLPPLRERREDIQPLVMHFVEKFGRRIGKPVDHIPEGTMSALTGYEWPGNIRELQNLIERAVILSNDGILPNPLATFGAPGITVPPVAGSLKDTERVAILQTLEQVGWVVGGPQGAAAKMGLARSTLIHKMEKLGIYRPHSVPTRLLDD